MGLKGSVSKVFPRLMAIDFFKFACELSFRFMDLLYPKDERLVVFCGGRGLAYIDNSRFLFEKFIENYKDLNIKWVTRNKNLVASMNEDGKGRFVYQYSLEGVRTMLSARTVFFSWGPIDIPGMGFSRRTRTVMLWHGIPIKSIGFQERWGESRSAEVIFKDLYNFLIKYRFRHWVTSSFVESEKIALCTRIPMDRILLTGYPRNDHLIEQMRCPTSKLPEEHPYLNKKVILYAPTWRPGSMTAFFPFEDNDFDELNSFLVENDAILLVRGHLVNEPDGRFRDGLIHHQDRFDFNVCNDRILLANRDVFEDFQEILPFVDVMISDYSGGWVDYLLLDRPLVFVPYDLEKYEERPGLLYDYDSITPGPKVDSFRGLMNALGDYLRDPSKDSERRQEIKSLFHEYEDGLNYRRIHDLVLGK